MYNGATLGSEAHLYKRTVTSLTIRYFAYALVNEVTLFSDRGLLSSVHGWHMRACGERVGMPTVGINTRSGLSRGVSSGGVHSDRNCCFLKVVHTTVASSIDTPYYDFPVVCTLLINKTTYRCHEKTSYVSKAKFCRGNEKIVPNGKFELKLDFGIVIMFNTSKIMICYLLLIRIIKSNMIFMNFCHIGDFHWHKLTHGRYYRP